ncbi:MAG: translation elongation factor Ts [Candidatus Firestonebacteria bacterium]|nr:translation elongation factor Ts [Candidatus Firestonebacteria bacterium]
MSDISAGLVKELREKTGAGIMECKEALKEKNGDIESAISYLRVKGIAKAEKKSGREASEGNIGSYIHAGGKIGVLVEINCETDFVAKTDDFQALVKDVAMHIAAMNPLYIKRDEVPSDLIEKEKSIYKEQMVTSGKPAGVIDKIAQGKLEKYFSEVCLLEQPFVKTPEKKVEDLVKEKIAKLGENIMIKRFARFKIGEINAK